MIPAFFILKAGEQSRNELPRVVGGAREGRQQQFIDRYLGGLTTRATGDHDWAEGSLWEIIDAYALKA